MNAVAYAGQMNKQVEEGRKQRSPMRLARITGLLYLALAVVGVFSNMVVESLRVPGDAEATSANVLGSFGLFETAMAGWVVIVALDAAIAIALYVLLKPASRALSADHGLDQVRLHGRARCSHGESLHRPLC